MDNNTSYKNRPPLEVSPELLKELPLPEGWTWADETEEKWPGAVFWGSADLETPRMYVWTGRAIFPAVAIVDRRLINPRLAPEDTVVASMDEAYRMIWHKIVLGV